MITISFNGHIIKISKNSSIMELLTEKKYNYDYCAVSLNRQFIPRIYHASTLVQENDIIEIITPMQGG